MVLFIVVVFGIFFAVNNSFGWSFDSALSDKDNSDHMNLELKDPRINPIWFSVRLRLELLPESKTEFLNYFRAKRVSDLEGLDRGLFIKSPPDAVKLIDKLIESIVELNRLIEKNLAQENRA